MMTVKNNTDNQPVIKYKIQTLTYINTKGK